MKIRVKNNSGVGGLGIAVAAIFVAVILGFSMITLQRAELGMSIAQLGHKSDQSVLHLENSVKEVNTYLANGFNDLGYDDNDIDIVFNEMVISPTTCDEVPCWETTFSWPSDANGEENAQYVAVSVECIGTACLPSDVNTPTAQDARITANIIFASSNGPSLKRQVVAVAKSNSPFSPGTFVEGGDGNAPIPGYNPSPGGTKAPLFPSPYYGDLNPACSTSESQYDSDLSDVYETPYCGDVHKNQIITAQKNIESEQVQSKPVEDASITAQKKVRSAIIYRMLAYYDFDLNAFKLAANACDPTMFPFATLVQLWNALINLSESDALRLLAGCKQNGVINLTPSKYIQNFWTDLVPSRDVPRNAPGFQCNGNWCVKESAYMPASVSSDAQREFFISTAPIAPSTSNKDVVRRKRVEPEGLKFTNYCDFENKTADEKLELRKKTMVRPKQEKPLLANAVTSWRASAEVAANSYIHNCTDAVSGQQSFCYVRMSCNMGSNATNIEILETQSDGSQTVSSTLNVGPNASLLPGATIHFKGKGIIFDSNVPLHTYCPRIPFTVDVAGDIHVRSNISVTKSVLPLKTLVGREFLKYMHLPEYDVPLSLIANNTILESTVIPNLKLAVVDGGAIDVVPSGLSVARCTNPTSAFLGGFLMANLLAQADLERTFSTRNTECSINLIGSIAVKKKPKPANLTEDTGSGECGMQGGVLNHIVKIPEKPGGNDLPKSSGHSFFVLKVLDGNHTSASAQ